MKAVGGRLPRYDGRAHVAARTTFVDDVRLPGMLWAAGVRSTRHSARIVSVDTSAAAALPGVRAIVTHRDVPDNYGGAMLTAAGVAPDEPYLAEDEVRWHGQLIAGVAAEDQDTARRASELVKVEYEDRVPLFDMRRALDPDAPRMVRDEKISRDGNTYFYRPYNRRQVRKGDVRQAFANADLIVRGVYRTSPIEHAPMEPQAAVAVPVADGRLEIYTCTQGMYYAMGMTAATLQVPLNRLKFIGGTVGGGFGGKVDADLEPLVALLAQRSGRPVKWRFTREEEFLCSSVRASWHMEIADALSADGWLLGRQTLTLHDSGAYLRLSPYGAAKHTFHLAGSYTIPNMRSDTYVVHTNHVPTSAMRGFGVTSASFAVESQMTRDARLLGLDPWEFRLRNANRSGDLLPTQKAIMDPSAVTTMKAAAKAAGIELRGDYQAMDDAPRGGALLPEHLRGSVRLAEAEKRPA